MDNNELKRKVQKLGIVWNDNKKIIADLPMTVRKSYKTMSELGNGVSKEDRKAMEILIDQISEVLETLPVLIERLDETNKSAIDSFNTKYVPGYKEAKEEKAKIKVLKK